MTSSRRPLLQLPQKPGGERKVFRRKSRPTRLRQFGSGLLLGALGCGLLAGLLQIPARLDAFLLLSEALVHLIEGVSTFLLGFLQLLAVVLLVVVALGALVLVVAGVVRLVRACLPRRPSS